MNYDFEGWIIVDVLSGSGIDCSMNGITVDGSELYVKVAGGNFTEAELLERKAEGVKIVFLVEMKPAYQGCPIRFHDREAETDSLQRMFGGNYVVTSDSRFSKKYPYPISIHDRIERY